MSLRKGDPVEVCSDEEGFKGVWFPATIVRKVGVGFLVQFRDLMTDDEKSKLREKVGADEIRPQPPHMNRQHFLIDELVDAYDQDGWWEGVIDNILDDNNYIVFFSYIDAKAEFNVSQLRLHMDWIDNKWLQPSQGEITIQLHPVPLPNCQKNIEHISPKPERRSPRLNKFKSKTYGDGILAEDKADAPCGYMQSAGSKLSKKSGKRKLGAKYQLDDASSERKKMDVAGKDMESVETFSPSKKQIIDLCVSPAEFSKETEVTFPEDQHKEINPILHALGGKRVGHGASDSHSTADKNIVVAIPYPEDKEKTTGYPVNSCEISANANLKQIELHAYHSVLKALYLQGNHTWKIEILLTDLREVLHITHEEHATELTHITSAQRK